MSNISFVSFCYLYSLLLSAIWNSMKVGIFLSFVPWCLHGAPESLMLFEWLDVNWYEQTDILGCVLAHTAITKYHRLRGLHIYFSKFWRLGSPGSWCQQIQFLLACCWPVFCCVITWWKERERDWGKDRGKEGGRERQRGEEWTRVSYHLSSSSSVQFSRSVASNSLRPHESHHARPPCPSPTPGVHSDSRPWVSEAIQPSHPLSSPSSPAPNPSQHQSLFQWCILRFKLIKLNSLSIKIVYLLVIYSFISYI